MQEHFNYGNKYTLSYEKEKGHDLVTQTKKEWVMGGEAVEVKREEKMIERDD